MVSSATCEPCDLELKRKKGPYLMPLFVLSFVLKKHLEYIIHSLNNQVGFLM